MTQATSGIASLIEKIKQDGVHAGEQARSERIAQAEKDAEAILAKAREQARKITEDAEKAAKQRRTQLEAELRMAARDFAFRLQERIVHQVVRPEAEALTKAALADPAAVSGLVVQFVQQWGESGGKVFANAALKDALVGALGKRIGKAAEGGVEIVDEAGQGGFRLVKQGEHFAWDVSADAVARELAQLVEPGLRELLLPEPPKRPASGSFRAVPADAEA
ncbi:MAG: hypothetical protein H6747_14985 [Deltaproteobacteria bacterium]|nr:hypothetical protein [Deltaproteobacteria bacterium]